MKKIHYVGCFFDRTALFACPEARKHPRLDRSILHPHVTFAYRPSLVPRALFGLPVTVRVTGYGCDGENEAFSVAFEEVPENLRPLTERIALPHITLSVSRDGKPVNSKTLSFAPVPSFLLCGTFGGMDEAGTLHLSPEEM